MILRAIGSYASYSRWNTFLPWKLSRVTPEKVVIPPAPGCSTALTYFSRSRA